MVHIDKDILKCIASHGIYFYQQLTLKAQYVEGEEELKTMTAINLVLFKKSRAFKSS